MATNMVAIFFLNTLMRICNLIYLVIISYSIYIIRLGNINSLPSPLTASNLISAESYREKENRKICTWWTGQFL